jgi:hypothetical protein
MGVDLQCKDMHENPIERGGKAGEKNLTKKGVANVHDMRNKKNSMEKQSTNEDTRER